MIITILKIRLSQFFRLLKEIGVFRIVALLVILCLVFIPVFNFLILPENTVISLIVILLSLLSLHSSRNDKHFIKTIIKSPYSIYLSEYVILMLPVFIIWIVLLNWIGIGLLFFVILLVSLISINLRLENLGSIIKLLLNPFSSGLNSKFTISLPFISISSFEWISGVRRNLILLVPVYLFILAFSFKPYVAVVGVIFLSILVSGFFYYGESREFIELFAKNPQDFILRKLFINLKQLLVFCVPIITIAIIFQVSTWYYLIVAVIYSSLIQVLAIIFKYGLFEENTNLNRNSIIVFINIFCVVVPLFWPIPIIMGMRYYEKARVNHQQYFYD